MWHIMTEVLKWYTGKYGDAEAKVATFAAVEAARAAHLTAVEPASCRDETGPPKETEE